MLKAEAEAWIAGRQKRVEKMFKEFSGRIDRAEDVTDLTTAAQIAYTNELLEQILLAVSKP
jgi:hypothetical protein